MSSDAAGTVVEDGTWGRAEARQDTSPAAKKSPKVGAPMTDTAPEAGLSSSALL